jgi:hypothetical protein
VALAWLGFTSLALAGGMIPPPEPGDAAAGKTLAEQIRSAVPQEDSEIRGVLTVTAGKTKDKTPMVCEVKRHGATWETIYQSEATVTAGAERLVIVHSTNGPSQFLYARAAKPGAPLPTPAPVPPASLDAPFASSDFSLGDLGLEFLHWPGQSKLKGGQRLGQPCFVLESTRPQTNGIVRVNSWIDEETLGPLVVEAFDSAGREVKEFSLDSSNFYKDAQGRWHLEQMSIENKKTRSRTDLKFDMPKEP